MQYIIPVMYKVSILLTTQSMIDTTDFNLEKCVDYISTGEEVARVIKEDKLNCKGNWISDFKILFYSLAYIGNDWIDYQTNTVNIDTPEIKKAYELGKKSFLEESCAKEQAIAQELENAEYELKSFLENVDFADEFKQSQIELEISKLQNQLSIANSELKIQKASYPSDGKILDQTDGIIRDLSVKRFDKLEKGQRLAEVRTEN